MTTAEIIADPRFRRAVRMGEYSRSIAVFLRLQNPAVEDLSTIPRDIIRGAQIAVDNAFFAFLAVEKELEEEMR